MSRDRLTPASRMSEYLKEAHKQLVVLYKQGKYKEAIIKADVLYGCPEQEYKDSYTQVEARRVLIVVAGITVDELDSEKGGE